MTIIENLLVTLMEECDETSQRASKAARFSLAEVQPGQNYTNGERLMHEYADLMGVYRMLQDLGAVPEVEEARIAAKKIKVGKYLQYSQELGSVATDKQL